MKFRIRRRGTRDSSTIKGMPFNHPKSVILDDTRMHSKDVRKLVSFFVINEIFPDVKNHDYTKIVFIDEFYDFLETMRTTDSKKEDQEWWQMHVRKEPHHALDYTGSIPIHLGHLIHMGADWMCASKSRSNDGKWHTNMDLDDPKLKELCYQAFLNYLKWLDHHTAVLEVK